jgi:hypothetical protein
MGNKKSGNPYMFSVSPDSELGTFMEKEMSKFGLGKGSWVLQLVLKTYEKEFRTYTVEVYGKDLYDDTLKKLSVTTYERKRIVKQEMEDAVKNTEQKLLEKKNLLREREEKSKLCSVCGLKPIHRKGMCLDCWETAPNEFERIAMSNVKPEVDKYKEARLRQEKKTEE